MECFLFYIFVFNLYEIFKVSLYHGITFLFFLILLLQRPLKNEVK